MIIQGVNKALNALDRLRQIRSALASVEDVPEGSMDEESRDRVVALLVLTRCGACPNLTAMRCPLQEALMALDSCEAVMKAAAAWKDHDMSRICTSA